MNNDQPMHIILKVDVDIKIAELKRRLEDEERRRLKLEEDFAEEQRESEVVLEAKESQVVALQDSLIELRERERR